VHGPTLKYEGWGTGKNKSRSLVATFLVMTAKMPG
jgi:hypothetical protein